MPPPPPGHAPAPPRRRRGVVLSVTLASLLVVGGGVVLVKSDWWGCHVSSRSGGNAPHFTPVADPQPSGTDSVVEQIEQVPGVGAFLGSATLGSASEVFALPQGGLVVADRSGYRGDGDSSDSGIDPFTGTTAWSFEREDSARAPVVAHDSVFTVDSVSGPSYRLSAVDAEDGSMGSCITVDRFEDRDNSWGTSVGGTIVLDRVGIEDLYSVGGSGGTYRSTDTRAEPYITGVHASTGARY